MTYESLLGVNFVFLSGLLSVLSVLSVLSSFVKVIPYSLRELTLLAIIDSFGHN